MSKFNSKKFTVELEEIISEELIKKSELFKNEIIGALAIDCHPWHSVLELCFLTRDDKERKWWLADWRYFQFTRTESGNNWIEAQNLTKQMADYYSNSNGEKAKIEIFKACAAALNSTVVKKALNQYSLEKDFELFISDPDDADKYNFCVKKSKQMLALEKLKSSGGVNQSNENGITPFWNACYLGDIKMVELLFKEGVDATQGLAPACYKGHKKIIEFLLKNKADIKVLSSDEQTVLMSAVYGNHIDVVKLLIKNGANVNAITVHGETALSIAKKNNQTEIIEFLKTLIPKN